MLLTTPLYDRARGRSDQIGRWVAAAILMFSIASGRAYSGELYPFFSKWESLGAENAWLVSEFNEGEPLDLRVVRWKTKVGGGVWTSCRKNADCDTNTGRLAYGFPVYAPVNGKIASCGRNFPENPAPGVKLPGVQNDTNPPPYRIPAGGNHMWIDAGNGEMILLAHLQPGTIPESVCPNNISNINNINDKTGSYISELVLHNVNARPEVKVGQYLGMVGNSGNSLEPHLHIQVNSKSGDFGVGARLPVSFRSIWITPYDENDHSVTYEPHYGAISANSTGPSMIRPMPYALDTNVSGHYEALQGDFNGDGNTDVFWYGPGNRSDWLWLFDRYGIEKLEMSVNGDYDVQVGDFNGDAISDILWYAPGASDDYIWFFDQHGSVVKSKKIVANGTYSPVVGNFNADASQDIFWYSPGDAPDYLWLHDDDGNVSEVKEHNVNGAYQPLHGDFDGNGMDDIFWYASGVEQDHTWFFNGNGNVYWKKPVSVNGSYQPVLGNFDGNDTTDIFWYAPGEIEDFLWLHDNHGNPKPKASPSLGGNYKAVTGDFDNNGVTDILWYGVGNFWGPAGMDYFWLFDSNGNKDNETFDMQFNGNVHQPFAGDFDYNGFPDIFLYAPGDAPETLMLGPIPD